MSDYLGRPVPEVVAWTIREVTRSLFGFNAWNHVNWMTGSGGNGKSRFISFLQRVFGHFHGTLNNAYWTSHQKGDTADSSLALVVKKRICFSVELEVCDDKAFASEKLKGLSGQDPVVVRRLHENAYSVEPHCSAWIAMNQIPKFDGTDGGMRRRIKRLVFPWSFGKVNEKRSNYSLGVAYNIDVKLASDDWRDAFMLRLLDTMKRDLIVGGEIPNDPPYPEPAVVSNAVTDAFKAQQGIGEEFFNWAFDRVDKDDELYASISIPHSDVWNLWTEFTGRADDADRFYKTREEVKATAHNKPKLKAVMETTMHCVIVGQNWKGIRVKKKREARCVLNVVSSDDEPEPYAIAEDSD
jgi:hypothetical protein